MVPEYTIQAKTGASSGALTGTSPILLEALLMPADDGLGLDDHEDGTPIRPRVGQPRPEDAVPLPEPEPFRPSLQDGKLLTEGEVLGG